MGEFKFSFFGKASGSSQLALVMLFPALTIHCAGYGTVHWMKTQSISNSVYTVVGLWEMADCSGLYNSPCIESAISDTYKTNFLTATRVLETFALVLILIAIVTSSFYVTSPASRIQSTAVYILLFCATEIILSISGVIVWASNLPDKHFVHWSAGLTLIAAAFCLLSVLLMVPDIRRYDYMGLEMKKKRSKEKKRIKKEKRMREIETSNYGDITTKF